MALTLRKAQGNRPGDWKDDDYDVMWDGQAVGRIYRRSSAGAAALPWFWSVLIIAPGITRSGLAATLDQAKAAFAESWSKWLASSGLHEDPPRG